MKFRWLVALAAGALAASALLTQGVSAADLAKAQQIATRVCAVCHGTDGNSTLATNPVLAGQHADYTAAQLRAFRSGERANDPNRMMRAVADKLSDREIAAVAEYISGLR